MKPFAIKMRFAYIQEKPPFDSGDCAWEPFLPKWGKRPKEEVLWLVSHICLFFFLIFQCW